MGTTNIVLQRHYPTYQACLEIYSEKCSNNEVFNKTFLYISDWVKGRIKSQVNMEELSALDMYPGVSEVADFTTFNSFEKDGISINEPLYLRFFKFEQSKAWAIKIIERDNGAEFSNNAYKDKDEIKGRSFITEIGLRETDESVTLAVKIICEEPTTNKRDALSFRPAFIKTIFEDENFETVENRLDRKYKFKKVRVGNKKIIEPYVVTKKNRIAFLNDMFLNPNRQMPIVICPESVRDVKYISSFNKGDGPVTFEKDICDVAKSLLGYSHVVIVEDGLGESVFNNDFCKCVEYGAKLSENYLIFHTGLNSETLEPEGTEYYLLGEVPPELEGEESGKPQTELTQEVIDKVQLELDWKESGKPQTELTQEVIDKVQLELDRKESGKLQTELTQEVIDKVQLELDWKESEEIQPELKEESDKTQSDLEKAKQEIHPLKKVEEEAKKYSIRKQFSFEPALFYREVKKSYYEFTGEQLSQASFENLEHDINEKQAQIIDLDTKLKDKDSQIGNLKSKFKSSQDKCLEYKSKYESAQNELDHKDEKVDAMKKEYEEKIRKQEAEIRRLSDSELPKPDDERQNKFYSTGQYILLKCMEQYKFEEILNIFRGGIVRLLKKVYFDLHFKEEAYQKRCIKFRRCEILEILLQYNKYLEEAGMLNNELLMCPTYAEFYPGEFKDVVYDVLYNNVFNSGEYNALIDSLLNFNNFDYEQEVKKEDVRNNFRGKRNHSEVKGFISNLGFELKSSSGHHVYSYYGDERYKISVASSGSDVHGMENLAESIIEWCL